MILFSYQLLPFLLIALVCGVEENKAGEQKENQANSADRNESQETSLNQNQSSCVDGKCGQPFQQFTGQMPYMQYPYQQAFRSFGYETPFMNQNQQQGFPMPTVQAQMPGVSSQPQNMYQDNQPQQQYRQAYSQSGAGNYQNQMPPTWQQMPFGQSGPTGPAIQQQQVANSGCGQCAGATGFPYFNRPGFGFGPSLYGGYW
jgi:hypothetical protein